MTPKIFVTCSLIFISISLSEATSIKIENTQVISKDLLEIEISWNNSWKNERNYDAAWIFFKVRRGGADVKHVKLSESGHQVLESDQELVIKPSTDRLGAFIYCADAYKGVIKTKVQFKVDTESLGRSTMTSDNVESFGIEMVYIPEGGFTLGEPGDKVLAYGGIYQSDDSGSPAGLIEITSEDQSISIGPKEGQLYYQAKTGYEGDQKGIIPSSFPLGYGAFYIMKYEPKQGEYAAFLNTLTEQQSHHRANFGGKTYYDRRGSITIENNVYKTDFPDRPCNFMSWDDAMAFADWAGLRPMTETEFVKASRGPGEPQENEFPWNTNSYETMTRRMGADGNIAMTNDLNESELSEKNRESFGASYYWVMDLAGSMWERVISIGHEKGRNFQGVHGNGDLTSYGFADVEDWPTGVDGEGGFGFRGGGYYVYPMDFTEFNPYSPIAYRRYGGWAGGNRKEAYGARFVRTAD